MDTKVWIIDSGQAQDTIETSLSKAGFSLDELKSINPHIQALDELEPGVPINIPVELYWRLAAEYRDPARLFLTGRVSPYAIAERELKLNVSEDPRPGHDNPRIVMYHATTSDGAMPDEVPWCSSFVNYCVEIAGLRGTDSKAARSWLRWGIDVTTSAIEGDIVVFWRDRPNGSQGHVAFFVEFEGSNVVVLGGNQGNRVRIARYSRNQILGIRRSG